MVRSARTRRADTAGAATPGDADMYIHRFHRLAKSHHHHHHISRHRHTSSGRGRHRQRSSARDVDPPQKKNTDVSRNGVGVTSRSHLEEGVLVLRTMWCYVQERPEGCLEISRSRASRARACVRALLQGCGTYNALLQGCGPWWPFCRAVAVLQGPSRP